MEPNQTLESEELNDFLLEKQMDNCKLPEQLEGVESFPLINVGITSRADLRLLMEQILKSEEEFRM